MYALKQNPSFSLLKTKEELAMIKANEMKTKNRVNYLSKEHSRLQQKVSQMQKVMDTRAQILEKKNKDKELLMQNKEFKMQMEEQKVFATQSHKKLAELRQQKREIQDIRQIVNKQKRDVEYKLRLDQQRNSASDLLLMTDQARVKAHGQTLSPRHKQGCSQVIR